MIVNIARPMGVEVSKASWWETKSAQRTKLLQGLDQLFDAPDKRIKAKDQDHVEGAAACIGHQRVQTWTALLRAASPVRVNSVKLPAAFCDQVTEALLLHSRVLVKRPVVMFRLTGRTDPQVQARALGGGGPGTPRIGHGRMPPQPDPWEISNMQPSRDGLIWARDQERRTSGGKSSKCVQAGEPIKVLHCRGTWKTSSLLLRSDGASQSHQLTGIC
jgi:hypothetical protein